MAYSISSGGGLLSNYSMNWYSIYKMDYMPVYGMNYAGYGSYSGGGGGGGGQTTQSFPTSAYGQTVPVLWGIGRVPGGYIWATDTRLENTGDGIRVLLSARLRFARPLVPDSRWSLRRMWSNGRKIYDATTGQKPSSIRPYDGHSSQGRDSRMVAVEGAENVSAHRGYLDVVLNNYNIGYVYGEGPNAIPAFEAEWVQDDTGTVDVDATTGFFSNAVNTYAAADWENGRWFGITTSPPYVRVFDVGLNREIYAVPLVGVLNGIEENSLRYIPEIDRLVGVDFVPGFGNGAFPCIIDPATGAVIDHSAAMGAEGQFTSTLVTVMFGSTGVLIASTFTLGHLSTHRFTAEAIERVYISGSGWGSRGRVQCFAVGEVTDRADVYAVAGDTLYKLVVNSSGGVLSVAEVYTDADDLVYCVFYDGGVIVWNDNQEVMRVSAAGAVEWTETVPYQISTEASSRALAPPDLHRLDDDIMVEGSTSYWFTSLGDGETTTTAKTNATVGRQVYDGTGGLALNTDRTVEIARRQAFDAVGDGDLRDLGDFLTDLMVSGGFDASEVNVTGVDDQIRGAVIDITSGTREVVRSVADPYSIAIWERDGQIITKRALTDGSFAVDATIPATDIVDQGGQAIRARRLNPEEFIARYGINYRDPDEIYQSRPQWGEIPSLPLAVAPTDIGVSANVPVIADADTIKILATKKVNRLAIERHEFELRLKAKYADLEPEDIIRFTFAGRTVTARVFETTLNPDFTITVTCTEFLSSVAVTIAGGIGNPVDPPPTGTALSKYLHLDIPLMNDTDDTAGGSLVQYHVLASSGQSTWSGATLYRKDGNSYFPQASQVTDGLVLIALEVLPDVDIPYVTEFARTLEVARVSGDADLLTSITYQQMCEGGNMFAIGQPGRWEICHVQTITDNGDNTYTFETLRRGRGSSEEYTGDHAVGDLIVWLSEDNVQKLEYALDALNDAFDFKPVGIGATLANTIAVNRTITGEAEKIPKPCQLDAVVDGSDIDLSWVRRSRIGSYWADDGDDTYTTPLGESLEQYVIRIKDGPGGSVLRTATVDNAEAYTYTAANITTDFGSMPSELTWDIRQVSGAGVVCPTRETTITL